MINKTITSDFLTTVSLKQLLRSFWAITIKFPVLKYWNKSSKLSNRLRKYLWLDDSKVYALYNWRSSIYQALKILWLKKSSEVIVPWYTCVSVSNAVIQSWAKIVYSDIDLKTLSLDIEALENSITKKTKVIIVQHTFWKPANIKKICSIAKKLWIFVIEDCAHSLWSKFWWEKLWTFWDISIFSTWRDKVISSVSWWLLVVNNSELFNKSEEIYSKLRQPSLILTIRNHLYNIVWFKAYKAYDYLKLWRILIHVSRKLWLITDILSKQEKECNYSTFYYKLPNSLSYLALKEFDNLKWLITHRRSIWEYYEDVIKNKYFKPAFKILKNEKNNYFRLPIIVKNEKQALKLFVYMRMNWVLLWKTWSYNNIVPFWVDQKTAKYKKWSCPIAEDVCKRILLLPNHSLITPDEAKRVVKLLNNFWK